jgi:N6-adenosine-specific RNA methylase IME4
MIDGIQGGPFDVILADPPWRYNDRRDGGTRFCGGAAAHYATMADTAIVALPVGELAAARSTLFLWATWPRLTFALDVIAAWGFEYVTIGFLWVKTRGGNGQIMHGVGYYSKSNTEPCLLARRGRAMKPAVDDVSSVVVSPLREHSRKPEAVRTRIQRMYPTARKVELFCRESADGWATFGNEVDAVGFARQRKLFSQEGAQ